MDDTKQDTSTEGPSCDSNESQGGDCHKRIRVGCKEGYYGWNGTSSLQSFNVPSLFFGCRRRCGVSTSPAPGDAPEKSLQKAIPNSSVKPDVNTRTVSVAVESNRKRKRNPFNET